MSWRFGAKVSAEEKRAFANSDLALGLPGELINHSKTTYTRRVEVAGQHYYVKRYLIPGKHLRRLLGRTRVVREWRNLAWLEAHDIPVPRQIVMGQGNRWGGEYWGVIVTQEVPQTIDLRKVYRDSLNCLDDRRWRLAMLAKLARVVARMHGHAFLHNDLQWRNVLVGLCTDEVYLIDCPSGRSIYLSGNRRGVVRELAFLDKMGKLALSKTDRLRFYMIYTGVERLRGRDKQEIRRVLGFLRG